MRIPRLSLASLIFAIGGHTTEHVAVFVIGESTCEVNIFFWGFKRAVAEKKQDPTERNKAGMVQVSPSLIFTIFLEVYAAILSDAIVDAVTTSP